MSVPADQMPDLSQISNEQLLAQIQAAQQSQNTAAMSHSGTGGFDPANSEWMRQWGPTAGMSVPERIAAGVGRGMVHTGRSVANLVGAVPDSVLQEEKKLDAPLLATGSGAFGNLIGETAITAPATMGASSLLGGAGKLGAALAASPVANSAIQGGMQGLMTSDPGERGFNTVVGATTGGALGAGDTVMRKLVNGLTRTPEAQALLDRGISLTPGQMNPAGAWNQFEMSAEHWLPPVKAVRENAEHQFQARAIGMGAAPGSAPLKPTGNIQDLLQQAYDSYAPLYDQAKGFPVSPQILNTNAPNVPLNAAFTRAAGAPGVPASLQKSENAWLQDRLRQLPKKPDSADLLQLRSDIRQRGRMANLKTDTDSGHVATIANRAEQQVTQALNSQLPPDALAALNRADSNYGNYKIVENAVAKSKDNLAGLTPQKLSQSIYESTQDPAYARGAGGPLRELAQQGTSVFQDAVPPTGKSLGGLALGAAGLHYHPVVTGTLAAGMGGLTLTPAGRAIAAGQTAPQRGAQQLIAALRSKVPTVPTSYGELDPLRIGGQLALRGATGAAMPGTAAVLPNALAAALMLAPPAATPHGQEASH
jgi:hypothetical protein